MATAWQPVALGDILARARARAREARARARAREADTATLDGDVELAEQLDPDSMDFLNLVTAVSERTGIEIPERDYPKLRTLDDAVAYLVVR